MTGRKLARFAARTGFGVLLLLAGCSGGGVALSVNTGDEDGGIGGTGSAAQPIIASGPITAFGSIFVGGIEFETTAAEVTVESALADESALRLGMVVRVTGRVNDDGVTGSADSVSYEATLRGPIAAPLVQTGDILSFEVFGLRVEADTTSAVIAAEAGGRIAATDLAAGQVVEVSGFANLATGTVSATRVEREAAQVTAETEVTAQGVIGDLDEAAGQFSLQGTPVRFDASTAVIPDVGSLANGVAVEVRGTLDGQGAILATRIRMLAESPLGADDDEEAPPPDEDTAGSPETAILEGTITALRSQTDFDVDGQPVAILASTERPQGIQFAAGDRIEVRGSLRGAVLEASEVELVAAADQPALALASGEVIGIDGDAHTFELLVYPGAEPVTVTVRADTLLSFSGVDRPSFELIAIGDLLTVRGSFDGILEADFIVDEVEEDKRIVAGAVADIDIGAGSFSLLGVTFFTNADTEFDLSSEDSPLASIEPGEVLRVEDEMPFDGVLSKVGKP